jgi:hypothetical protein
MRRACITVLSLVGLVGPLPAVGPPPSDRRVLDSLLAEYRKHGLPLPPKGAKPVGILGRYYSIRTKNMRATVRAPDRVGFLVEDKQRASLLLIGTGYCAPDSPFLRQRYPMGPDSWPSGPFRVVNRFIVLEFAIQCHSLGHTALAKKALAECRAGAQGSTVSELRWKAWTYWTSRLSGDEHTCATITNHLNALLTLDPELRTKAHRSFLAALEVMSRFEDVAFLGPVWSMARMSLDRLYWAHRGVYE